MELLDFKKVGYVQNKDIYILANQFTVCHDVFFGLTVLRSSLSVKQTDAWIDRMLVFELHLLSGSSAGII